MNVENFGGETFLSEDVAIGILQETKNSLHRAAQVGISEIHNLCDFFFMIL